MFLIKQAKSPGFTTYSVRKAIGSQTSTVHGKQKDTKEVDHPRLVGGRYNKQGNLHIRLIPVCCKTSTALHPPARILKVYIKAFTRIQSHIQSKWSQRHVTLSRLCPWNGCWDSGLTIHFQDKGWGGDLWLPWVQLKVDRWSRSREDLLQNRHSLKELVGWTSDAEQKQYSIGRGHLGKPEGFLGCLKYNQQVPQSIGYSKNFLDENKDGEDMLLL